MNGTCKAVICTLDNLPILKEQVRILSADECINEIIVVSNGSKDGTNEWLAGQKVKYVIRTNNGAGPGRNAGLDLAGEFDYVLMLDGGIRPLVDGTKKMLEYLERREDADIIGVEIPHFETNYDLAWRRWPNSIGDKNTYVNTRLSHTAYCLARYRAFDGLRFSEEGPFGEPGWGADDDEMAYQWNNAGISIHVVTNVHPFRRGSGSFRRLFKETGIWPNQYGSVYEKRVVWLQQNWPQYKPGIQWGEPWITVVIRRGEFAETVLMIKRAHDILRARRFDPPWHNNPNPYSVVVWAPEPDKQFDKWAEDRRLRQHHGDKIIVDGEIIKRTPENEATWAGDFRVWRGADWQEAVRPGAYLFGLAESPIQLEMLLGEYEAKHERQGANCPPKERLKLL